jgi:hypothetical protein
VGVWNPEPWVSEFPHGCLRSPAVQRLTVQQTTTDIEGKYEFADVRGGIYYVHALFATDHAVAEWLSTVVVQNNEAASIDLYNDTAVSIVNQSDR